MVILEAGKMLGEDVHVRNNLVHECVPVCGHLVGGVKERLAGKSGQRDDLTTYDQIETYIEKLVKLANNGPLSSIEDEPTKADAARLVALMHVAEGVQHLLHVDRTPETMHDCVPAHAHRPDEDLALEVCFLREVREDRPDLRTTKDMA